MPVMVRPWATGLTAGDGVGMLRHQRDTDAQPGVPARHRCFAPTVPGGGSFSMNLPPHPLKVPNSGAGRHPLKIPNFSSGGVSRRGAIVAAVSSAFWIWFGWWHVSSAGFLQPSPPWRPLPELLLIWRSDRRPAARAGWPGDMSTNKSHVLNECLTNKP